MVSRSGPRALCTEIAQFLLYQKKSPLDTSHPGVPLTSQNFLCALTATPVPWQWPTATLARSSTSLRSRRLLSTATPATTVLVRGQLLFDGYQLSPPTMNSHQGPHTTEAHRWRLFLVTTASSRLLVDTYLSLGSSQLPQPDDFPPRSFFSCCAATTLALYDDNFLPSFGQQLNVSIFLGNFCHYFSFSGYIRPSTLLVQLSAILFFWSATPLVFLRTMACTQPPKFGPWLFTFGSGSSSRLSNSLLLFTRLQLPDFDGTSLISSIPRDDFYQERLLPPTVMWLNPRFLLNSSIGALNSRFLPIGCLWTLTEFGCFLWARPSLIPSTICHLLGCSFSSPQISYFPLWITLELLRIGTLFNFGASDSWFFSSFRRSSHSGEELPSWHEPLSLLWCWPGSFFIGSLQFSISSST